MSRLLTVACVLNTRREDRYDAKKPGISPYDTDYVYRLQEGVDRHLSLPHRFVCLTEWHISGVECRLLRHDWPGWWAKLELFRPDLFRGRVLYLDLDTSVVGSLDDIASYDGPFAMIDDWIWPDRGASGVMAWEPSDHMTNAIYGTFCRMAEGAMRSHRGDQNWIHGSVEWEPLRQLYPGQIVSRWEECADGVPEGARIVCWHGTPLPSAVGWKLRGSRNYWREQVA